MIFFFVKIKEIIEYFSIGDLSLPSKHDIDQGTLAVFLYYDNYIYTSVTIHLQSAVAQTHHCAKRHRKKNPDF